MDMVIEDWPDAGEMIEVEEERKLEINGGRSRKWFWSDLIWYEAEW